jgi:hypothetical protein
MVLRAAVTTETRSATAICIALGLGVCYAVLLLGPRGVAGTSPFWALPTGLIGGALDIRNALSGYWWFIQDGWHWPLLALAKPNSPSGANAALFDVIPLVAIVGKLVYGATGLKVNFYPLWVTLCLALNAAALTALVRALGQRSVLGAVLAGAFGAMAPVVQFRFGHLALLAHWLPVSALAFYFATKPLRLGVRAIAATVALCLLASFVHLYLYVMTAAIMSAIVLQAVLDRRLPAWQGALNIGAIVLAGIVPLWMFGLLPDGALAGITGDFSRYSMNMLSPFWPQTSGVFRWTGIYWLTRGSIGATPGQYEGYDYLGSGALLLIILATATNWRGTGRALVRHPALAATFVVLTTWALSDRIYIGPFLVASYTAPHFLADSVLAWFRSSGRFFWPVGWFLVGFGIARSMVRLPPAAALAIGSLALLLQWGEAAPWRTAFARLFSEEPRSAFGVEGVKRLEMAIEAVGAVAVVPPVFCSSDGANYDSPLNVAALEVQVLAAKANARMAAVYLSRMPPACSKLPPSDFGVTVFLKDGPASSVHPTGSDLDCFDVPAATICSPAGSRLVGPKS